MTRPAPLPRRRTTTALAALALLAPLPAAASSDEAWAAFVEEVGAACRALVEAPTDAVVTVEVNPFGSEHYGAAVVMTELAGGAGTDRQICIFDKATKAAELTAPFPPETPD